MDSSSKIHWDSIYDPKTPVQFSWTQLFPKTSLDFLHSFNLNKNAKIIDVGGGDSKLVDYLLDEGFENITVLDISEKAIDRAKSRLGNKAGNVTWIVEDITLFNPHTTFDVWHDRATFHFLIEKELIKKYTDTLRRYLTGYLVIGTFSDQGPKKCSGLDVKQYNEESLTAELKSGFDKLRCITENHITPFNTVQNFLFCSYSRHLN